MNALAVAECTPAERDEALREVIDRLWPSGLTSAEIAVRIGSPDFEAEIERVRIAAQEGRL